MFIGVHFLAQIRRLLEKKKDLQAMNQDCGLKPCAASSSVDQRLWLWRTLQDLSIEDYEQLLPDSVWLATKQKLKLSQHRSSVRLTKGKECLSLPTNTTYSSGNGKTSAAGQNKLETTLRSQNRLSPTQKLNPEVCAYLMGFPSGWTESVLMSGGNSTNHPQNQGLNRVHRGGGNA